MDGAATASSENKRHAEIIYWTKFGIVVAALIAIALGAVSLIPRSTRPATPVKRPHVLFVQARLILPKEGDDLVRITFGLINKGNADATFVSKDGTYKVTDDPEKKVFKYLPAPPEAILVPALADAITFGEMRFKIRLTPEILAALNTGKARLFFFSRGEYRDARGRVYPLPFSAMYDPLADTHLIACPNDVTFK